MKYSEETKNTLLQLGVNNIYVGYNYVVYAISYVIQDPCCLEYITKFLYPDIARHFHTSWRCVERNIRTVINLIWKTENKWLLMDICGGKNIDKPTNKEFLRLMANYIKSLHEHEIAVSNSDTDTEYNIFYPIYNTIGAQITLLNKMILELKKEKSELEEKNETLLLLLLYFILNKKIKT